MFGLRQKLLLGFGGLLLIVAVIGVQSILLLSSLSDSTDVILQADYRSVVACQRMRESLQSIDSGIELSLLENSGKARDIVERSAQNFEDALRLELRNINLPGEAEKASALHDIYGDYRNQIPLLFDPKLSEVQRRERYLGTLRPLFEKCMNTADQILEMNQENMDVAGTEVKEYAHYTVQRMYIMLAAGSCVALVFFFLVRRWILLPLRTLTESAREIEHGNLDLQVALRSKDELAEFATAFNAMAASLRDVRQGDRARLARTEQTTQLAVDSLPDGVAVLSPEGKVEMVNTTAAALFGLKAGDKVDAYSGAWLGTLWRSIREEHPLKQTGYEAAIQTFDHSVEKFFLPKAVPIRDAMQRLVGITVVLADITHLRKLDELKSGLLSTTSHELKTPLTSLQMAIHLLLEEKLGRLAPRQCELLLAARSDVDRLLVIVDSVLDLSRIEAGRVRMDMQAMRPAALIVAAVNPLRPAFQNQGLNIVVDVSSDADAAGVWADPPRIGLVFTNLLSNALKYTPPGGTVTISAAAEGENIAFRVSDTGTGIPEEWREQVFEKFFRAPGQNKDGAGLGLAIAREIVEAHGGHIECQPRTGAGCTFVFTIKRADEGKGRETSKE